RRLDAIGSTTSTALHWSVPAENSRAPRCGPRSHSFQSATQPRRRKNHQRSPCEKMPHYSGRATDCSLLANLVFPSAVSENACTAILRNLVFLRGLSCAEVCVWTSRCRARVLTRRETAWIARPALCTSWQKANTEVTPLSDAW